MKTLHITVKDKIATYTQRDGAVVCGNTDYQIAFSFDSEWDAYSEKTARFIWNGKHFDQKFTGATCPMPAIKNATSCSVGVYVEDLSTTTPATIECRMSVLCQSTTPLPEGDAIYASQAQRAAEEANRSASEAADSMNRAEELVNNAEDIITTELAKRGQLKPEFANSVDECTDTSKLYVLPDGLIYAYMKKEVVQSGGTVSSNIALTDGVRISASDGSSRDMDGCCATDWIDLTNIPRPCTFHLTGVRWSSANSIDDYHAYVVCVTKDSVGNVLEHLYTSPVYTGISVVSNNENFSDVTVTIPAGNVASIRFSGSWVSVTGQTATGSFASAKAVLTYEKEGSIEIVVDWHSTGHAFVPADYEERIIKAETDIAGSQAGIIKLQQDMSELKGEGGQADDAPAYVRTEAERVSENILQTPHDFCFALVSDLHSPQSDEGLKHGGQALKIIAETALLDAIVVAGDLIQNWEYKTIEFARTSISNCRRFFTNDRTPTFWVKGNHDCNGYPDNRLTNEELYNRTSKQHRGKCGVVENSADPFGGYGYKDYDTAKVRLIFVNTSDNDDFAVSAPTQEGNVGPIINAHHITATQLQWLADCALDFSDKGGANDWTIVFVSHVPIYSVYSADYPNAYNFGTYTDGNGVTHERNVMNLANMVKAYRDKIAYTVTINGETVSKDFSALEGSADVAGFFNGHLHALKMYEYEGFKFVSVPPACNTDKESDDGNTYNKTSGTAQDTAFIVFTVNKENRNIHAYCYGAGYDREIPY